MAILIQNDKGNWKLYSKNGTANGVSGPSEDPQSGEEDVTYNTIQDFLGDDDSKQNRYDEGLLIPSDAKQDEAMRKEAAKQVQENHELLGNSCLNTVTRSLEKGNIKNGSRGILFRSIGQSYIPNTRFKEIKKDNPNATVIMREK